MDGVDFKITEPQPFSSQWWSHKFNGPALRYEISVSIHSGKFSSIYGPYPPGPFPDLNIFRENLKRKLRANEKAVADRGYRDNKCITPINLFGMNPQLHSLIRARHETLNGRLKNFKILHGVFRHSRGKHRKVVMSCANILQFKLEDEPLFDFNAV